MLTDMAAAGALKPVLFINPALAGSKLAFFLKNKLLAIHDLSAS
jgi:hypothetical protein